MRRLSEALGVGVGWALLGYCIAVGVEIVGRRWFAFSLQGVDEIGGYLMALIVGVGFTCALYAGAHIRIDILLPSLPGRLARWLTAAALATLTAFALFLLWQAGTVLAASWRLQSVAPTPLLTPLVVPQGAWVLTLALFVAATAAHFIRATRAALRADAP